MHGCKRSLRGFETGKIVSVNDQELFRRTIGKYLKRYSDAILFFSHCKRIKERRMPTSTRTAKTLQKTSHYKLYSMKSTLDKLSRNSLIEMLKSIS